MIVWNRSRKGVCKYIIWVAYLSLSDNHYVKREWGFCCGNVVATSIVSHRQTVKQ
jgi:hypothetical protein